LIFVAKEMLTRCCSGKKHHPEIQKKAGNNVTGLLPVARLLFYDFNVFYRGTVGA
jgi:hypothetical protein